LPFCPRCLSFFPMKTPLRRQNGAKWTSPNTFASIVGNFV